MAQDVAFWNWPADDAANNSNTHGWALASTAFYAIGALLLLLAPNFASRIGFALIAFGVAISIGVLGKVLVIRSRHGLG